MRFEQYRTEKFFSLPILAVKYSRGLLLSVAEVKEAKRGERFVDYEGTRIGTLKEGELDPMHTK
jgi:hypothetical protein